MRQGLIIVNINISLIANANNLIHVIVNIVNINISLIANANNLIHVIANIVKSMRYHQTSVI